MSCLYNFGIHGMSFLLRLASPFHAKAKKLVLGQSAPLPNYSLAEKTHLVWFHCASLGEFDQGLPVMNAYKKKFPDAFLLVTFFSPSGMEHYQKRDHSVDLACYLPLDTPRRATNFIAHFQPKTVYFVKYEFWYNHLLAAKKNGTLVYGVSSLFRPTHRFFKWYGGFFRNALHLFDHFYTQDLRSKELLNSIGIQQVTISGDTRYDRMIAVRNAAEPNQILEQFIGTEPVILLGSSWPVDEEVLLPALLKLQTEFKIIIAPHDISEQHIKAISALFQLKTERFTHFQNTNQRVLILDTIGQLTNAYQYATIAYVGGGFSGKLHNILEPAAFGVPIIIGPKHEHFPEAQLFLDRNVAFSITNSTEFSAAIDTCIERKESIHTELATIFDENKGAAEFIITIDL